MDLYNCQYLNCGYFQLLSMLDSYIVFFPPFSLTFVIQNNFLINQKLSRRSTDYRLMFRCMALESVCLYLFVNSSLSVFRKNNLFCNSLFLLLLTGMIQKRHRNFNSHGAIYVRMWPFLIWVLKFSTVYFFPLYFLRFFFQLK